MSLPDPYATAQLLLTAVVAGWTGRPLPTNRWVPEGELSAWDGEQLVVSLSLLRPGLPDAPSGRPQPARVQPVSASYTITLVRLRAAGLQPGGTRQSTLPSAAQQVTAGAKAGGDLTAMLAVLLLARESGSVVSHPTKMSIDTVRPVGPDGDLVGTAGTVTVLLGH